MIAIHLAALLVLLILAVGGKAGWIPYEKYMEEKEFYRVLLVILAANLLGGVLSWQNNQGKALGTQDYIQRPAAGEGSDTKQFLVDAGEEQLALALDIPQQPGEDEEALPGEEAQNEEESLREAILQAAAALNEEKQDNERYYLPSQVNGLDIHWSYPPDHSGTVILGLGLVAGFALAIARQRREDEQRQIRREQMLRDYPNLVTKLCLLVQAGMTVRRAFNKTALDYKKNLGNNQEKRYAYEEMLVTYYEMESGVLESQAYDNFGRRCGQMQYRTLATLLNQNLKKGCRGLVEILERESVSAFEDRKRQAKIQGEAAATRLLIPMMLMLVVVLVVIMVPACISFYG